MDEGGDLYLTWEFTMLGELESRSDENDDDDDDDDDDGTTEMTNIFKLI